jgi:colanic acid/amylovoran biosynthesis glycosyltransferase
LHAPPVLLCPAHLIERKGQKYLIEAIAALQNRGLELRLLLAGEGIMQASLQTLVAQLKLDASVTFLGQIEHRRLLQFYESGEADMVVLPTLHEGIPIGLVEAMSYGVPVIATAVGGIPELLRDGAGMMVSPKDSVALANAIESLVGDAELRRRISETGRRRIEEEYDVTSIVSRLLQLIGSGAACVSHCKTSPRITESP